MSHNYYTKEKNLLLTILLNVLITVAQIIGGLVSGSLALISDALHNFSDVLSLVFSYIAQKLSKRKASYAQTFGLKRAELIAAFVNALSLIIVAFYLIYEAVGRFLYPNEIQPTLVMWLAALGILVNGFSVLLLKNDSKQNLNMKSAYLHLLTDMLASIAVLIGGILMYYFQIYWIDSVLTFIIAIYLIFVGFDLLLKATKMLMLFTPDGIDVKHIVETINKIKGVNNIHHIHVWHLNEQELHLEAHLDCSENIKLSKFNELLNQIESVLLKTYNINHVNIQPEFQKKDPKETIVQD
ncbi:cation diffusion facilitator family transporter [uncultured Flavobacterium sp.]|uniref:cation diffusion facilitator family transporter n=1 Tax=uncultured Flavobacterium sp. TaxID=165435 RepID=UPI0030CA3296